MKIRWIKLRLNGEIEKAVTDRDVPSVGDGVYLDEIGYEVKGIVNTVLPQKYKTLRFEPRNSLFSRDQ